MNRLKHCFLCGTVVILSVTNILYASNTNLFFAVDGFVPALKIGMERMTSDRLTLKSSIGFCLIGPSLLSYNFFCTYKLTNPEKPFGAHLNFGFLDNYIDVISPMFSLGIGGGAGIHYRFSNSSILSLRLGVITGPAIDNHVFEFLTLPNFGIEYAVSLSKE